MTKITMLIVLFCSNIAYSKQNFQDAQDLLLAELSTSKEALKADTFEWKRKFYQSLIDDSDANIRLLGYSQRIYGFHELDKENSLIDIATDINEMIASEKLSQKSLASIAALCLSNKLKSLCDQNALFERQKQVMSDNAYIYLNNLNLAYEENNQEDINQAINNIAQSTYIDIFMYSHEGFRIKLESYVKDNPFPKNKLAMEKLWITHFTHLNPEELEEVSENMEDIMVFTMVIGSKLAESIPPFRTLIEVCKNNIEYEKSCLKLSEMLINKSKTIISTMIGYAIKIEIIKQQGNLKELKQVEKRKKDYKNYYECLAKIMNYGSTSITLKGAEFSKIADPIERTFGELAYFESLAKLNYDYYSKQGDENINNPENCGNKVIKEY